ncbi:MAG: hypothetical protein V5B40_19820 [Candidatus Accumulibacter meliphilus]|jgi:hypothetical protein|uniref:hypothetical protein n=1 Tax=Candidatus Accumulibacter meliphilus TaxID=2211374 RepID=UPI002FC33E02
MKKQVAAFLAMALGVVGCASEITRYPAELSRARQSQNKMFVASQTVSVHPDSGYERSIKLGTEFVDAGGIAQGSILKPTNAVFTVERRQVLSFALPKNGDVAFAVSRCVQ